MMVDDRPNHVTQSTKVTFTPKAGRYWLSRHIVKGERFAETARSGLKRFQRREFSKEHKGYKGRGSGLICADYQSPYEWIVTTVVICQDRL
jgi:hypothetical protein